MAKLLVITFLVIVSVGAHAAGPTPGLYAVSVQIENPMLGLAQTREMQQCITAGEFEKGPRAFLNQQQQGSDCNLSEYNMSDGNISITMSCVIPGGGKTKIVGRGDYTTSTFRLVNKIIMEVAGTKMDMQTTATGKLVGDC